MTVESNGDSSPKEGLNTFFMSIWGDTTGWAYLPTRDQKSDTWVKMFFSWPKQKEHIIDHVLISTAKGLDSYFAPALFKEPTRPIKDNIKGSNVLWAEFDGNAPDKWTPRTDQAPEQPGVDVIPMPSVRVQSSVDGHEHVYWKLEEFSNDIEFIEGSNRSIAYTLRADTSGWDINQILRPPYTTNYKHDLPVTLISNDSNCYNRSSFLQLKPALQLVTEAIDTEHLPEVQWLVAKYKWDEEHFKLFMDSNIEEGKRSHALMRLGYYCAEQGMDDAEAYSILSNAASRWGKFTGRLDRHKRLIDIVNRARQKHPVALDTLTFKGILGDSVTGGQIVFGMQEFLDSEIEVEWVIDGFIEKGGMGMVSSAPGVGKTQASIQLGIACALGKPFLSWNVPKPMKILMFSLEMGHVGLKMLFEVITADFSAEDKATLNQNFKIIPLGQSLPIDRPDSRMFIELMIDEQKPDGIIFDALNKLLTGELKEETARKVNDYMGLLRAKFGCIVWMIHHNIKASADNKKPNKLEDVFGSTFITADMTTVITLWENKDGTLELNQVKARFTAKHKPIKLRRDEHLKFYDTGEDVVENLTSRGKKGDDPDDLGGPFGFERNA
jgi:hypothetical protein